MLMCHMKRTLEARCTCPRNKLKYKDQTRTLFYGGISEGERRGKGEMQAPYMVVYHEALVVHVHVIN